MKEFARYVQACGSAAEAAHRLGTTVQYVYQMRNGTFAISLKMARKVEADSMGRFKARRLLELT